MSMCIYLYEHKIAIKVGTLVLNGRSGAAMSDEACQCKGTYVLNVRFGVCYILGISILCCEHGRRQRGGPRGSVVFKKYQSVPPRDKLSGSAPGCEYGNVVTDRQILLSRVKRLTEFKLAFNASVLRLWLKFSDLNDIVAVFMITFWFWYVVPSMEVCIVTLCGHGKCLWSVFKPWKSFIDSSQFIKSYGARHTQPYSHILSYGIQDESRYICLVDDDNETFKVHQQEFAPFVVSPLLKQYVSKGVGACHGLLCLYGFHSGYKKWMLVIWNPSFGIVDPILHSNTFGYGFGVCPVTKDPTVVKIIQTDNKPWHVEVFTLSSRVWNVIPSSNLPHQSIILDPKTHVVIDRFIYWGASEETIYDDGEDTTNSMLVSFDLITKEFKVIDLPNSLTNELTYGFVSVSKLRESLAVYGSIMKSGEPIFEVVKELGVSTIDVYDPSSQHIKSLGIDGVEGIFFMGSYKESLLLLDHSDSHIYYYNKWACSNVWGFCDAADMILYSYGSFDSFLLIVAYGYTTFDLICCCHVVWPWEMSMICHNLTHYLALDISLLTDKKSTGGLQCNQALTAPALNFLPV
ncbi:hypothetical protein Tco_1465838 [Tanacetum coccineum]